MIDYFLNAGLLPGLVMLVVATISYSLIVYLSTFYIFKAHLQKKHEKIGRILFRVTASLLALILSISFANQRVVFFNIQSSIEAEAAAIVDLKVDLDFFDTDEAHTIREELINYIMHISNDGWKSLEDDPFRSESFNKFLDIYSGIINLEAKTPVQERLKGNLLNDVDKLSDFLQVRLYTSRQKSSPLVYISIIGLAISMILFIVYPPDRITIAFLSLYVAFIGIVLYFILMMSNPLKGPLQIEPGPFLLLQETIESAVL